MTTNKYVVSLTEVHRRAEDVAQLILKTGPGPWFLYGVPRGGIPAAFEVAIELGHSAQVVYDAANANIIVDDIYDSGRTAARYNKPFYALFDKRDPEWRGRWLVMPWEQDEQGSADDIVIRLLQYIGEDPTREGLRETPQRVVTAWKEWTAGYQQNPADLFKVFEQSANGYDELIITHNIPVISRCEHHLSDIIGIAHVGYIPNDGRIVGLSKLARLVDLYARRLQVQERLTVQVVDAIMEHLQPKGAGCIIRAAHSCMSTRGVKIHGSTTSTSAMRGVMLTKPEARKEFLDLCTLAENSHT